MTSNSAKLKKQKNRSIINTGIKEDNLSKSINPYIHIYSLKINYLLF